MLSCEALRRTAARLLELADRAPTWAHRTELLDMAAEYDRLACQDAAVLEGLMMDPARA